MMRWDIINKMIDIYGYTSYLEIGVDNRSLNFNKIVCKRKYCVDPNPSAMADYVVTSDKFFETNKLMYDIIFIDGLHHEDQVLRDINNASKALNKNGCIVVHDCNPTSEAMQVVPRIQGEWTGDVWRAWVHNRFTDNKHTYHVIDTDYGVGVIRNGVNTHAGPAPLNKEYTDFDSNRSHWLNMVDYKMDGISVCIPVFEQYGKGINTLTDCLNSLVNQVGVFEVIVSDNSDGNQLKAVCDKYQTLPIKYFRNPVKGVSNNTNFAISKATFNNIKVLYQDDVLLSDTALQQIDFALKFNHWVACNGYALKENLTKYKETNPSYSDHIINGINTLGMPSVTAFRKNRFTFDPELKTLLDCEYYWLLYREYGEPAIIKNRIIGSRYWDGSTSRNQKNYVEEEKVYLKNKYIGVL